MRVGVLGLRDLNVFKLKRGLGGPTLSRLEGEWLTVEGRAVTVFSEDDPAGFCGIGHRDPGVTHGDAPCPGEEHFAANHCVARPADHPWTSSPHQFYSMAPRFAVATSAALRLLRSTGRRGDDRQL